MYHVIDSHDFTFQPLLIPVRLFLTSLRDNLLAGGIFSSSVNRRHRKIEPRPDLDSETRSHHFTDSHRIATRDTVTNDSVIAFDQHATLQISYFFDLRIHKGRLKGRS